MVVIPNKNISFYFRFVRSILSLIPTFLLITYYRNDLSCFFKSSRMNIIEYNRFFYIHQDIPDRNSVDPFLSLRNLLLMSAHSLRRITLNSSIYKQNSRFICSFQRTNHTTNCSNSTSFITSTEPSNIKFIDSNFDQKSL